MFTRENSGVFYYIIKEIGYLMFILEVQVLMYISFK